MSDSKILARVRALLAIAEHPNTTEHEADTALTQANKMMVKHAIDEAMIRSGQSVSERRAPTRQKISLTESWNEFMPLLRTILAEISYANRCQIVLIGGSTAEVFGMDEDVRWVEMLYTSVYVQFLTQINPRWSKDNSYDQNVYNFKVAGYKWSGINDIAVKNGEPTAQQEDGKISGRMISAYKRWAKAIGDHNVVRTQSHAQYRLQFSEAFQAQLSRRIRRLAQEAKQEATATPGAELALTDMAQNVRAAFEEAYPQFSRAAQADAQRVAAERRAQEAIDREVMLGKLTPKQRYDLLEKEQRQERAAAARNDKYWDKKMGSLDSSANARGRSAADKVDLSRKAGSAGAAQERGSLS